MSGAQASPAACASSRTRGRPQDTKALGPPPDPASATSAPAFPGRISCFSAWRSRGSRWTAVTKSESGSKVRQQKELPDPGSLGTRPCLVSRKMNEAAPREQGKIPLVQPGEPAGLAEGRGQPAGGRGMAEMSVLGTAWSPAGREGVINFGYIDCNLFHWVQG